MPTINVNRDLLFHVLGKQYSEEEFADLCFQFGIELDEVTTDKELVSKERGDNKSEGLSEEIIYKIEVPANRYDLLCLEGLAQALLIFQNKLSIPMYQTITLANPLQLLVKPSTAQIRTYAVAAVLRGMTFNKSIYNSFIDLQEKLHQNIGRMRKIASIGTHDLDTIQGPFVYDALPPSEIKFRPLNQPQEYTATELMSLYSGDSHLKPYLSIIQDKPVYPIIYDANRTVLSFPPIVNGDHSKINLNTKNVFIEVTATDLYKASVVLDTMVTMFSAYCEHPLQVEQVEVVMPDGNSKLYPELPYRKEIVSIEKVNSFIGIKENGEKIGELLSKMSLKAESGPESGTLEVEIPPTRHDIIHACDIYEDAAIAYGYNNIPCSMPIINTTAQELPLSKLTDKLRSEMANCTFTEALSFVLCSKEDLSEKIRQKDALMSAVHIANPKTLEFQVARTTLLPGLLKTLQSNRRMPLPLKLFEVADVVLKDATTETGARNRRHLAAVWCGKQHGLEQLHGVLDRLLHLLGVAPEEYELHHVADGTFLEGQSVDVSMSEVSIGKIGVVHPDVLSAFHLPLPCSALEINIERFL